ncbi:hypothetical protein MWU52_11865 [Jannaschia sp. S6380]|uniref:hypothetical protein n=1 Tax=Jannaschia sp. S6380 TaxID=2926408 RepID=UPI001FF52C9A|nr:hypothetical protein [Jannaschia sp. S6380]MCK0168252.1 hypothetical protein [Jannaschia sp. S6380]
MTVLRIWLASLFLALAAPAGATPIPVLSGEHADFSRLVFAQSAPRIWTISGLGTREVRIAFRGPPPDLDLGNVFDRIPRTRLRDIGATGPTLRLALGCACDVDVRQIASGHIVIDLRDPPPERVDEIARGPGLWPLAPHPFALRGFAAETIPADLTRIGPLAAADAAAADLQVRLHPARSIPLLPDPQRDRPERVQGLACPHEAFAEQVLQDDPAEAMSKLRGQAAALIDANGRDEGRGWQDAVRLRLVAGLGTEAIHVARTIGDPDPSVLAMGAALDDLPRFPSLTLDPACGPATTLLALLDAASLDDWARVDSTALIRFVDALPPLRWQDIEPRLRGRLARADRAHLLDGLHPAVPSRTEPAPDEAERLAARTDFDAVLATTEILRQHRKDGRPVDELHLVNALALRGSVPEGPERTELDLALAGALVVSRHPADALRLVDESAVGADLVLHAALTELPATAAVEFIARLRPYLSREERRDPRIAALFEAVGLPGAASRFAGGGAAEQPRTPSEMTPEPWLTRDLGTVADDPEERPARRAFARLVVAKNLSVPPTGDLARAERDLDDSRALRTSLERLIMPEEPS